jgi:environmental stress-induced protein Ves
MQKTVRRWKLSDCKTTPWKNGGGITTELIIWPHGATLDNFEWRISMAQVASDGPFSHFPGVDRSLAILAGAGVHLHSAGQAPVTLTSDSAPYCFDGEQDIAAQLCQDAVTDLNVMTRRTRWQHRLQRITPQSCHVGDGQQPCVLYCARGLVQVRGLSPVEINLHAGELLMVEAASAWSALCADDSLLYLTELQERSET